MAAWTQETAMARQTPAPPSRRALLRLALALATLGIPTTIVRRAALAADPRLGEIWRCSGSECPGYEYDPMEGDPDSGVAPGTAFQDLPDDWFCPRCGAGKPDFRRLPPTAIKK